MVRHGQAESKYPGESRRRTGYFARYAKALYRSGAIGQFGIGPVSVALFVASIEDKKHYREPPEIWRDELKSSLGIGSNITIIKYRQSAVDSGLLYFTEGSRYQAAIYWSLVPDWLKPFISRRSKNERQKHSRSENEPQNEPQNERFPSYSSSKNTQYPTTHNRQEWSSSVVVDFGSVKIEEVKTVADDLYRAAFKTIDRELVWQMAYVGLAIDPAFVPGLIDQISSSGNAIRSRKRYIEGAMRKKCEAIGYSWEQLRRRVPGLPNRREAVA